MIVIPAKAAFTIPLDWEARQWWNFITFIAGADLRTVAWQTGERRLPSGARAFIRVGPDRAWA